MVIYPQWIVDVMACLVTVHQGVVKVNVKVGPWMVKWLTLPVNGLSLLQSGLEFL